MNGTVASGAFDSLMVGGNASLAGTMTVTTPGSATMPGYLPYNQSYNVLSTSSLPVGSFNNNSSVVQTEFASDNATSGIFNVNYGINGVTLSDFHQIYVMSVGVTDFNYPHTSNAQGTSINGDAAANSVSKAFQNVAGVVFNTPLDLTAYYNQDNSGNVQELTSYINYVGAKVHPGDTVVFYVNAHGAFDRNDISGPETPIYRQTGTQQPVTYPPVRVFNSQATSGATYLDLSGYTCTLGVDSVSASTFAGYFSGTQWQQVNKLFVMDTCYAGGFWKDDGTLQYLAALPHSAIIAASPEVLESYGNLSTGGDLGTAFADVIGNLNGSLGSFGDLLNKVTSQESTYFDNFNGDSTSSYVQGTIWDGSDFVRSFR